MCYPKYPVNLSDIRERRSALRRLQQLIVIPEEEAGRFGEEAVANNFAAASAGGGGGGGRGQGARADSSRRNLCLCSPTSHAGSFRCRLHRSSYQWGTRRPAASVRRRTMSE